MYVAQLLTFATWPLIGLVAYWARDSDREPRWPWLPIHLVLGPLMLIPIAWRFVAASARPAVKPPKRPKPSRGDQA